MIDNDELQIDVVLEEGSPSEADIIDFKKAKERTTAKGGWEGIEEDTDEISVLELIDKLVEFKEHITQLTVIADWDNDGVTISGDYKEHTEWARHGVLLNAYITNLIVEEQEAIEEARE